MYRTVNSCSFYMIEWLHIRKVSMDYSALLLSIISAYGLLILAIAIVIIIGKWKVFKKAGKPGWASLVPFYNDYIEFLLFWGNGWLFIVPIVLGLFSPIPILGQVCWLLIVIIRCVHRYKEAESFGQGLGFALGLIFLKPIFICILGFGNKYEYHGVPIDGYSYRELKEKFDSVNKKDVNYEQPEEPRGNTMKYEQPDASKKGD